MANLLELQTRVKALNDKEVVYGVLFEVIKRFESYLIDFNLIQLEKGQDASGQLLGTYSRATEIEALFGEGPRPIAPKIEGQPYNFQWTGGLFDGMRLEVRDNTATFTSTDSKTPLLVEKYGNIFGLQPQNLEEAVRAKLYPALIGDLRARLQL